jgi:hypothetical protein
VGTAIGEMHTTRRKTTLSKQNLMVSIVFAFTHGRWVSRDT